MQQSITHLIVEGVRWVNNQRSALRSLGRKLSKEELTALLPFYSARILETVIVCTVPVIENPHFYQTFSTPGQSPLIDFSKMDAITFIDTIAVVERQTSELEDWLPLLFHECVHVCQYDLFGVDGFLKRYVEGWATNEFNYFSIPFEQQAYTLQSAFEKSQQIFSVEEILKAANQFE
jgi:hypothetical protein